MPIPTEPAARLPHDAILAGWHHTTAEIPERGLEVTRKAGPAELAATAAALDIPAVERLSVTYRIAPRTRGRYKLTGRIQARVVQACVVTLDPVASDVIEGLDAEFRPEGDLPSEATTEEQEALAAEEHEPIEHHRLHVGRVIFETLAAALPAYPRAPDAALDQHEAGPTDSAPSGPFAALGRLKPKPD